MCEHTVVIEDDNEDDDEVVFTICKISDEFKFKWVADSGATKHMCHVKERFDDLKLYHKPIKCSVGDGHQVDVIGEGNLWIISLINGMEEK